jgi:hypothetical protein
VAQEDVDPGQWVSSSVARRTVALAWRWEVAALAWRWEVAALACRLEATAARARHPQGEEAENEAVHPAPASQSQDLLSRLDHYLQARGHIPARRALQRARFYWCTWTRSDDSRAVEHTGMWRSRDGRMAVIV